MITLDPHFHTHEASAALSIGAKRSRAPLELAERDLEPGAPS